MIARRAWHKWPLVNGGRWISPYTFSAPSPAAVHSFHNSPFRVSTFELVSFSTAASTWFRFADQISNCRIAYNVNGRWFSSEAMTDVAAGGNGNGIVDVPLAQTGEGIAECELLKWFVREGDQVDEFQPLCEVQSDKATIEITSRYLGKVSQLLHVPGDIVKVGEILLKMAVEESQVPKQICESLENRKTLSC